MRPRATRGNRQLIGPKGTADIVPVQDGHRDGVVAVDVGVADIEDGGPSAVAVALPRRDAVRVMRIGRDVASKHLFGHLPL